MNFVDMHLETGMIWFSRNPKITILYLILFLCGLLSLGSTVPSSTEQDATPSFNNDFLYLNVDTGNLMIWRAGTAEPEVLADSLVGSPIEVDGSIVSYTASEDGHNLALVVESSDESYEILWLDLPAMELESIGEFSNLPEVKISPNGRWVAYREEEMEEIFAVDLYETEEEAIVGTCEEVETDLRVINCGTFSWSPNSAQLVWSDGRGLWIAQPPAYEKKVLNNPILRHTEEGDSIVRYWISSWSPDSRYLVLGRLRKIEGIEFELLDVYQGKVIEIPHTSIYVGEPAKFTWLDASHLSVLITDFSFTSGPLVEVWEIDPTSSNLLTPSRRFHLAFPCAFVNQTGQYENGLVFYLLRQINLDKEYCDAPSSDGLYLGTSPGSYLSHVIEYHTISDYVGMSWSPDYQFAVLYYENWETGGSSYVDLLDIEQQTVEDLTPFIGESKDVCCFTWVE